MLSFEVPKYSNYNLCFILDLQYKSLLMQLTNFSLKRTVQTSMAF